MAAIVRPPALLPVSDEFRAAVGTVRVVRPLTRNGHRLTLRQASLIHGRAGTRHPSTDEKLPTLE